MASTNFLFCFEVWIMENYPRGESKYGAGKQGPFKRLLHECCAAVPSYEAARYDRIWTHIHCSDTNTLTVKGDKEKKGEKKAAGPPWLKWHKDDPTMAEGHVAAGGCGGHIERWTPTEDNRKGMAGYICNSSKRRGRKRKQPMVFIKLGFSEETRILWKRNRADKSYDLQI